jgi:hypothetical protein
VEYFSIMPYRADITALKARAATVAQELAAADEAASTRDRLRAEMVAIEEHLRAAGIRAAHAERRPPVSMALAISAAVLVGGAWCASAVVLVRDGTSVPVEVTGAVPWPPSPGWCLDALQVSPGPVDAHGDLEASFDALPNVEASLVALSSEPPPPRATSESWGMPTLTLTARSRATPGTPLGLSTRWTNTTVRTTAILSEPAHRRDDAAYVLFVKDEGTGRVYQLRDTDRRDYCGTHSRYHASDVLLLAPGARVPFEARTPSGAHLSRFVLGRPGSYTVWLAYRFCGYGGPSGSNTSDFHEPDMFVGVAVSNAVHVEVEGF